MLEVYRARETARSHLKSSESCSRMIMRSCGRPLGLNRAAARMGSLRGSGRWTQRSHLSREIAAAHRGAGPGDARTKWSRGRTADEEISPATEPLVFTGEENEQVIHAVFDAGARSYILKSDISQHLIAAIEALAQHKHYFTTHVSEVVFAPLSRWDHRAGHGPDRRAHTA